MKMENADIDPNNPIVQVEVLKVNLKHAEEKISQQEESLKEAYITRGQLETKLQRASDDYNDMRVTLEGTKRELAHKKQALSQGTQKTVREDRQTKWIKLIADGLFLIAMVCIGIGGSELGSTPPNSLGSTWIVLGCFVYIAAAVLNTVVA